LLHRPQLQLRLTKWSTDFSTASDFTQIAHNFDINLTLPAIRNVGNAQLMPLGSHAWTSSEKA